MRDLDRLVGHCRCGQGAFGPKLTLAAGDVVVLSQRLGLAVLLQERFVLAHDHRTDIERLIRQPAIEHGAREFLGFLGVTVGHREPEPSAALGPLLCV